MKITYFMIFQMVSYISIESGARGYVCLSDISLINSYLLMI